MPSDTEIVNAALTKLGQKSIGSLDELSKGAKLAKRTFPMLRDVVLQNHAWNFAIRRAQLAAAASDPVWGFDARYALPEGGEKCLRVLEVNNEDQDSGTWQIEGRYVVTSLAAPIEIKYVAQVTDYGDFTPLFAEALAARCAQEWALQMTGQDSQLQLMERQYRDKLAEARGVDGQEGTPRHISGSTWIDTRY